LKAEVKYENEAPHPGPLPIGSADAANAERGETLAGLGLTLAFSLQPLAFEKFCGAARREDAAKEQTMKQPEKNAVTVKTVKIASFAELAARVEKTIPCVFQLDGELLEIPVRRVSPALADRVRKLRRSVTPPWNPKINPPHGDYDPLASEYLGKKDAVEAQVRALIVYTCCPVVAEQKPGLLNEADMAAFVQGVLSENILDLIMLTAQAGGMNLDEEVQRRANFSYTPGSEN
jgi:hypothetical protein